MAEPMHEGGLKLPPTYPPKSPPPPKRPVEPQRPHSDAPLATARLLPAVPGPARMSVRNRRSANWTLTADKWAARKAARHVTGTTRSWGYTYPQDETLVVAVQRLIAAVLADGGKRLSLHLADQDDRLLILALSHRPDPAPTVDEALAELAAIAGAVSCGTDAVADGRRVWVLLDTAEPRARTSA
ncbi:hypothetical protein [Streptomyces antimicrobicus]|uniref:Uncharacterized protein n=1 Tax=Streptomyces antimicrobicus TaxID=2883108 RepID=A0ABS8AZZ3_9ACTN|nr:hypothetical protein [Streptomyces antimicrobicus]MCB5177928.1 hypothetical protein [Streptomyces antimicrobicus]